MGLTRFPARLYHPHEPLERIPAIVRASAAPLFYGRQFKRYGIPPLL